MTELDLLKKLLELENKIQELIIHIKIPLEKNDKIKSKLELKETKVEIENIKISLIKFNDKRFSSKAKESMIKQIEEWIDKLMENVNSTISTNQGFINLENELFIKIEESLNYLISGSFGIQLIDLNTISKNNLIETNDLIKFLKIQNQILRKIDEPNYIKLREFYIAFMNSLIKKYKIKTQ